VSHSDSPVHSPVTVEIATTGAELFPANDVVAVRRSGELLDLSRELLPADVVEPVTIGSPDGLNILRHSAAHVLAQAVQALRPDAKLGIGPPIADGFY